MLGVIGGSGFYTFFDSAARNVNLTLGRLRVYNFLQESDKLLAGVSGSGLAEHLAGSWI